mmetsp:Transcript_1835/g.2602  ORF Transcript_1835/g.2602 Transcript_1835/m.2602 type:complete len:189 (-) Transcript_1835:74-640(-)
MESKGSSGADSKHLPKLVVLDLDNTVWTPELYELYGMPVPKKDIDLFPASLTALKELATDKKWSGSKVAVASRTGQVKWAHKLLSMFKVTPKKSIEDVLSYKQIYPGSKLKHFRLLKQDSGLEYEDMIFFDDDTWNTDEVSKLGVLCVHCPYGMSDAIWKLGISEYVSRRAKGQTTAVTVGGSQYYDD